MHQPLGVVLAVMRLELSVLAGDSGGSADLGCRKRHVAQARIERASMCADAGRSFPWQAGFPEGVFQTLLVRITQGRGHSRGFRKWRPRRLPAAKGPACRWLWAPRKK